MVSASTQNIEIYKSTFRDELQRSVLLRMNEQIEDQPESSTADGYKTHIELLSKRLTFIGRQTVYTDCMTGHCLSVLKQIYRRNTKFCYVQPNICLL